jgi:hypothetical protein
MQRVASKTKITIDGKPVSAEEASQQGIKPAESYKSIISANSNVNGNISVTKTSSAFFMSGTPQDALNGLLGMQNSKHDKGPG